MQIAERGSGFSARWPLPRTILDATLAGRVARTCSTTTLEWQVIVPTHPLHQAIGRLLDGVRRSLPEERRAACVLIKDPACVSGPAPDYVRVPQSIPLFCSKEKGNDTEYCNVDALVLLDGEIKVIVEIEESALGPTQVFGKFLSSAAARNYIHDADGGGAVAKADEVAFIQVMDTSDLKPRSSKRDQWRNIEASIRALPTLGSIRHYHLLHGDENDFTPGQPVAANFADCVRAALVGAAGAVEAESPLEG